MNIYRSRRNARFETGLNIDVRPQSQPTREEEILSTVERKVAQGVSAAQQYADLNAARDKRKRRRERNIKTLVAGGYKQVLLLEGPLNGFQDFKRLINPK